MKTVLAVIGGAFLVLCGGCLLISVVAVARRASPVRPAIDDVRHFEFFDMSADAVRLGLEASEKARLEGKTRMADELADRYNAKPFYLELSDNMPIGSIGRYPDTIGNDKIFIEQVVDNHNLIAKLNKNNSAWLEVLDASNIADQRFYSSRNLYEVVGTKKYRTVLGGQRTLPLLRSIDPKETTAAYQRWERQRKR